MDPISQQLMMGAAGSGGPKLYVEDVFSTWLYTGNGSTQTITNGIDLSGKGGLVWLKNRTGVYDHWLWDTARGAGYSLNTNNTGAQVNIGTTEGVSFGSTGFSFGNNINWNQSGTTAASWTFRKQAKFFDVVTWTGNNVENRAVAHSLGSTPGCIIVKQTSASGQNWHVWHRSINPAWTGGTTAGVVTGGNATGAIYLNSTAAFNSSPGVFTYVNSTAFGVYYSNLELNSSGSTYVAYLFAHDAGGFGDSGNDSVVKCGSYTGNGSLTGPTIDLGWEPQWLLVKSSTLAQTWYLVDTMRGLTVGDDAILQPNLSDAEFPTNAFSPLATGFQPTANSNAVNANGQTYIYIAIRRGPMKTPTDATKVFEVLARTGTGSATTAGTTVLTDVAINKRRDGAPGAAWNSRLQNTNYLDSSVTDQEFSSSVAWDTMTGIKYTGSGSNGSSLTYVNWNFRRAPGFFDVVAYTGTGSLPGVTHNLKATPELKIIKRRSSTSDWVVGGSVLGESAYLYLNTTDAKVTSSNYWDGGDDSSTVFSVRNTNAASDASGSTYIAYLFATCPGVSKVGSYTGTGTTLNVDCGFTNGARFVLIKRTDSTGDWFVWDTARGIVSGNDPYLLLNSTAAEVTSTDYIDPLSSGFQISSTAPAAINANGGSFIFLAIA